MESFEALNSKAYRLVNEIQARDSVPENPAAIKDNRLIVTGMSQENMEELMGLIGVRHFKEWDNETGLLQEELDRVKCDMADSFASV